MLYNSSLTVFGDAEFFQIHFIENRGMAFGYEFGGMAGKLALSIFRIIASGAIIYAIHKLIKSKSSKGLITCVSLILAGAIGNILDSAFYGLIFDKGDLGAQYTGLAGFSNMGEGYAPFLMANVVDMFHFEFYWPGWMPFGLGGSEVFPPIFNVADSAITVGVIWILLFQRRFFPKEKTVDKDSSETSENSVDFSPNEQPDSQLKPS